MHVRQASGSFAMNGDQIPRIDCEAKGPFQPERAVRSSLNGRFHSNILSGLALSAGTGTHTQSNTAIDGTLRVHVDFNSLARFKFSLSSKRISLYITYHT